MFALLMVPMRADEGGSGEGGGSVLVSQRGGGKIHSTVHSSEKMQVGCD